MLYLIIALAVYLFTGLGVTAAFASRDWKYISEYPRHVIGISLFLTVLGWPIAIYFDSEN